MKTIGSSNFHIRYWEIGTMSNLTIKAYPFKLYYERNYEQDDTRIQFGAALLDYRIGICLDYIG